MSTSDGDKSTVEQTAAWVIRQRQVVADRIAQEEKISYSDEESQPKLGGINVLRVAHAESKLRDRQSRILTLADQQLVNAEGELIEEDDVLESTELVEEKRAAKASKERGAKSVGDVQYGDRENPLTETEESLTLERVEELLDDEGNLIMRKTIKASKDLLPHYDHWETLKDKTQHDPKEFHTKILVDYDLDKAQRQKSPISVSIARKTLVKKPAKLLVHGIRNQGAVTGTKRALNVFSDIESIANFTIPDDPVEDKNKPNEPQLTLEQITCIHDSEFKDDQDLYNKLKRTKTLHQSRPVEDDPSLSTMNRIFPDIAEASVDDIKMEQGQMDSKDIDLSEEIKRTAIDRETIAVSMDETSQFCRLLRTTKDEPGLIATHRGFTVENKTTIDSNNVLEKVDKETVRLATSIDSLTLVAEQCGGSGLANTLKFLKEKGDLFEPLRTTQGRDVRSTALHTDTNPDGIKLDYKDSFGRAMTPKEAFRHMSWVFHGKLPGKKKMEKRLVRQLIDRKTREDPQSAAPSLRALKRVQEKEGSSYMVLSGQGG